MKLNMKLSIPCLSSGKTIQYRIKPSQTEGRRRRSTLEHRPCSLKTWLGVTTQLLHLCVEIIYLYSLYII